MNPRIRELAEQAGITTNLDTDFFDKDPNKWVDYYSEKFAELIVRECADRIDDLVTCDDDGNQMLDCDDVRTELLEYFGVEQ